MDLKIPSRVLSMYHSLSDRWFVSSFSLSLSVSTHMCMWRETDRETETHTERGGRYSVDSASTLLGCSIFKSSLVVGSDSPELCVWIHLWAFRDHRKELPEIAGHELRASSLCDCGIGQALFTPCCHPRRQWHPTPVLSPGKSHGGGAWWAAVHGVAKSRTWLRDFTFTFHFHAWEKEMATHSSVLAWRIPGMGEPGGLPSMGSHRVGHDWRDLAAAAAIEKLNRGKTNWPPLREGKLWPT